MHPIDPTRLDLAREFKQSPFGPHSQELQKVLKIMRWDDPDQRYISVQLEPGGSWYLARTCGGRNQPLEVYKQPALADQPSAQWAIFRMRWQMHTGEALSLDDDPPLALEPTRTSANTVQRPLLGYSDRFSVSSGERIQFKVSATVDRYHAEISRIRCGDDANIGLHHTTMPELLDESFSGREQPIYAGSYVDCAPHADFSLESFCMQALIWPTAPLSGEQIIMGSWDRADRCGVALLIDKHGHLAFRIGDGQRLVQIDSGVAMDERYWYFVSASVDEHSGLLRLAQVPQIRRPRGDTLACVERHLDLRSSARQRFRIAAGFDSQSGDTSTGAPAPIDCYNGKIESPRISARAQGDSEFARLCADQRRPGLPSQCFAQAHWQSDSLVASWNFSLDIASTRIRDVSRPGP